MRNFLTSTNWTKGVWQRRHVAMISTYLGGTCPTSEVIIETINDKAIITLNRPKALNALNLPMIKTITPLLREWQKSKDVKLILIKGTGEKAFCAGGDVRAVTENRFNPEFQKSFFMEEYKLNYLIGTSTIPWIALIDGITMGGGVGLSVHGKFRVATERTVFAMPETAIGLIPDVGGGHFLPKLSSGLGNFLALTGFRLKGKDTFTAGISTHFVESAKMKNLEKNLISLKSPDSKAIEDVLNSYQTETTLDKDKPFVLADHQSQISKIFSSYRVEDIVQGLESDGSDWSKAQLTTLSKMSPTSLKVTLEQQRRGRELSLKEDLEMEYRVVLQILMGSDLYEGVRALLVDKDSNPKWDPPTLEGVTKEIVDSCFNKLPPHLELVL